MSNDIVLYIFTSLLGAIAVWGLYITRTIISINYSVKYMNKNLYFIDWDKVPRKNLNDVFHNEKL